MDSHLANSLNENVEEILFSLDKKVFYIHITFQSILCIAIQIFCSITNENVFSSLLKLFAEIFILSILVFVLYKIKNHHRVEDIIFSIIVIGFDITSLFIAFTYSKVESNYTRMIYQIICFGLITMNIKQKMNKYVFIYLLAIKIIILILIFQNYNFNESKIIIFLDFFMIIYSFAMIFVNRIIKSIFLESLIKLNNKNIFLGKKLQNILNSMKYSVCSIDLKQNEIYFNSSFYNFIHDNFRNELFGAKDLFSSESNYSNIYLKLIRNLKSDEKSFLDKFNDKDEIEQKKCQAFFVKILILNRIFDKFELKGQSTPNTLNLFKFFKEKNTFLAENYLIQKGEYRMDCGFSEKKIEIFWKKSLFNDDQELINLMFNDITELKEHQLNENDITKMSTPIITQNLEIQLNSINLYTKKLATKLKSIESGQNILDINELHNDLYTIEGLENYVTCLINDLKEHSKDDLDLEIKLELIELREIIEDVFHILKSLKSSNLNKRNINLLLNIDENIPKSIISDSYRIKQLLVNLLSNSFKFTNFGYIKLNVKYEKSTSKTSYDEIKFSVEDTGVGVNQELQTKLSEKYEGNSNKSGLSICKKIVRKLGDSIGCVSKNKLTTFNFTLYNFCDPTRLDLTKDNSNYITSTISDEQDNSKNINSTISDENTNILGKRNHKLEIIKEHHNPKEEETQRIVSDILSKNNSSSMITISQMSDDN